MKTDLFPAIYNKVGLIFIMILLITSMMSCQWIGYGDALRENITLEEAQSLVSFPICIPAYIPPEIDSNPQIIYEADSANVAEETYIRLKYKYLDDKEKAFEVYQRYTNKGGMSTEYTDSQLESRMGGAIVTLFYWISPNPLSESELNVIKKQAKLDADVFQTDQTVCWLYEITDPSEYRSTMTEWIIEHVDYRILSYLPAEEIEKVTLSMFDCSKP